MHPAGVENVDLRVRLGKGPDKNQSREKSSPEALKHELASTPEPSSPSIYLASGSHSNTVF
jgi:hypothetical protein